MPPAIFEKIDTFFTRYPGRQYPKGQIIIFGNEEPEAIFYIAKGRVREYDISYRGEEITLNSFKNPAFFPMSWAINRSPSLYFYKTETASTIHRAPADDALQFLKNNPDVTLDLLGRLYRGVDGLLGKLARTLSDSARNRIIYELIIECHRFGKNTGDGAFELKLTGIQLAAQCGLSRETVSRELNKMQSENVVRLSRGKMIFPRFAALQEMLDTGSPLDL